MHDPAFAQQYPALSEWLTLDRVDGVARQTATLLVFSESGMIKVCLSDREHDQVCFRAGLTFQAALESLEGVLASGEPEWRPRRDARSRR